MRITICDDEPDQAAMISRFAAEYIDNNRLDVAVRHFADPAALLEFEERNGGSEIYLLDIVMDMSGLELGWRIRSYNERAIFIYITNAREYSLDAFSVHAFSFLLKPIDKARLFAELDCAFQFVLPPTKTDRFLNIKTADGIMPFHTAKVDAVEYQDHHLILHVTDRGCVHGITGRGSFDAMSAELGIPESFIKCSDSYLVNMENILSVSNRGVRMKSGREFPVTRKYSQAREQFLRYKLKGRLTDN